MFFHCVTYSGRFVVKNPLPSIAYGFGPLRARGAGLISYRAPYVMLNPLPTFQVSCAYAPSCRNVGYTFGTFVFRMELIASPFSSPPSKVDEIPLKIKLEEYGRL